MKETRVDGIFFAFWASGLPVLDRAHVAQLAEHVLGKDEVVSSILTMGSILEDRI
jgi:hypothetical protein